MKVLIAGATRALGVPLVGALLTSGHEVIGLTRTPDNVHKLSALGAQPVVADAMDRDSLLRASNGLHADAVAHVLPNAKRYTIAGQPHNVADEAMAPVLLEFFQA
jgi:uncharacterized protein YbjT (DUF2867 family)